MNSNYMPPVKTRMFIIVKMLFTNSVFVLGLVAVGSSTANHISWMNNWEPRQMCIEDFGMCVPSPWTTLWHWMGLF
ncbi:hypothetical protein J3F84DRAFT_391558 [Trichoderma pleuroticola]